MKNFEVGERVQFIYEGKLQTGIIEKLDGELVDIPLDGGTLYTRTDEIVKLDQPKPVPVPEAIGAWLRSNEEHADLLDNYTEEDALADTIHHTIYGLFANFPSTNPDVQLREPVLDWLCEDRRNYFKLVDAVRNGYVVEEEQKYYVRVPLFEEDEDASELVPSYKYLAINARSGASFLCSHRVALAGDRLDSDWKSQLTEEQIKSADERYWQFAVPVEAVEAE